MATGPSLSPAQIRSLRSVRAAGFILPVIAVNNAYESFPEAEMLYACDRKWWDHYRLRGALGGVGHEEFQGVKATLEEPVSPDIHRVGNGGAWGFDPRPDHIRTGKNSAAQAAHLAIHAGAVRILLLGCDCRVSAHGRVHHFGEHAFRRNYAPPDFSAFLTGWSRFAAERPQDVEIVNCSPDSAIDCFPRRALDDCLSEIIKDPDAAVA